MLSSLSLSGAAAILLHIPMLGIILMVVVLATGDSHLRQFARGPAVLLLAYLVTVALVWSSGLWGGWFGAGFWLLILLFAVPLPLFFVVLVMFLKSHGMAKILRNGASST
ncbi:MAG: hypothetical protein ACT6SF_05600 [Hydrogenophaga sp.]|jgi:hypothetical protein|uniref:hypothetical protein n=1 Tax=Hydrogenophaga sp. TaxID=1904254 RepID=UPI001D2D64DF|nr:hypothetical protein [Hydrogenophaga sp.]MBW0169797.1 hypothetical protein [Hydrogenophaga sp.]MBW0185941.1 hypothetical protein [Hydrogenophaga sp.]